MEVIEFLKEIGAKISKDYANEGSLLTLWFDSEKAKEFSEYFEGINDVFECQLIGGDLCIDIDLTSTNELFGETLTKEMLYELGEY